jgi:glyoxylase-like metal-dependent hydrolase (beta-lactamase superfamily II)
VLLLVASSCASVSTVTSGNYSVHTFTRDSTHAHLLVQGDAMVLIDIGYEANASELASDLRAAGFDPAKVRAVIVTHAHSDHAGAAHWFQEQFHVPLIAGAGDEAMLKAGANEPLCPTGFLGSLRHGQDQAGTYQSTTADTLLAEPLDLKATTGVDAKVVPLPGHTKGSLVVIAGDLVFVGDLFRGSLIGSGAATHLYMCDLEGNKRDVAKLLNELAPSAKLFLPGHFGPVERQSVAEHFEVPSP